ncbi:type II toxin-antitoxin system PemK/MazF family toxin [Cronobacter sakazakii]|nr:type II toxin-antitoxin system PemK/MazF family toxin [Cronobacter sakazakii]EMC4134620.1 type II toxin-antitoxin system PemK/MazF family toxin [Cronobacter sakazakii]MDK1181969.1 type II toxin-antitoxin system PemK/MazF family toxin [Cronobacter sakazakii]
MSASYKHNPLPTPGDIVWCHFPITANLGNPGPKPRPALVIAVSPEHHAVKVVYGTSQKTDKIYKSEFVLKKTDANFSDSGLAFDTKFDMNTTVTIPYDSDWFDLAPIKPGQKPTTNPKMGVLHLSYLPAVKTAMQNSIHLAA